MTDIVLIAHNLRSCHNVGSLLRTAEGLGVSQVYATGYTPFPLIRDQPDARMPHIANKLHKQIAKTALGAEDTQSWSHHDDIHAVLDDLREQGYQLVALEQTPDSIPLPKYQPPQKLAIVLGREAEGMEDDVIAALDVAVEIPMFGHKESFNVVQAAAMALYHCRFYVA